MPRDREPFPDFSDVRVQLKPILGIPPGLYLTVLYAALLLLILFWLFLLPGLRANGTQVSFYSFPPGASVWVDGEYRGATPCRVFVPQGERDLRISKAYYRDLSFTQTFDGRLFGSRFAPRRATVRRELEVEDWRGLLEDTRGELAAWGMMRDFSVGYAWPPLLKDAARAARTASDPAFRQEMVGLLENATLFVDSSEELRDVLRGLLLLNAQGGFPGWGAAARSMKDAIAFLRRHPASPYWVIQSQGPAALRLSGTFPARVTASEWFASFHQNYLDSLGRVETGPAARLPGGALSVESVVFLPVPGGTHLSGRPLPEAAARVDQLLPHAVRLDPFYIAEREITRAQYRRFLEERPDWGDVEQLTRRGLVDEGYLAEWDEATGDGPASGVSHHAARAFSRWLTGNLPEYLRGRFEVRLPTEAEWEWAASAAGSQRNPPETARFRGAGDSATPSRNQLGIQDMWGGLWEWVDDWYFPAGNLLLTSVLVEDAKHTEMLGSERIVKGGSWANAREEIQLHTRGSQPPHWTSAYTGFRVVLARVARLEP